MGVGVNRLFLHRLRLWWWRASWVLPVAAVLAALLFQMTTDSVDEWLYAEGTVPFVSGASATALLAAVGGGMVTFTGLVFSFVVLVLQFGSSQYSPRTVAYLVRNRLTQWVLALFIFTITFCFIGLIEVGSQGRDDFEPQTTVLIAVILLLASLIGFVAMLHTVGGRIRVDRVLSDIGRLARLRLHTAFRIQSRSSTTLRPVPATARRGRRDQLLRISRTTGRGRHRRPAPPGRTPSGPHPTRRHRRRRGCVRGGGRIGRRQQPPSRREP